MRSYWDNDLIQFARLLCEIIATQDSIDYNALCQSMNLAIGEINELFDRAENVWEDVQYHSQQDEIFAQIMNGQKK